MKCPACEGVLTQLTQSDITVDVCDKSCGGIWFDSFELQKVDEGHEAAGETLLDVGPHKPVPLDHSTKRRCPKCPDITLIRHFFSVKKEIEIDECGNCGGVWLDSGELAAIRSQFNTEQDRKKAFNELFTEKFSGQLDAEAAKSLNKSQSRRRLAGAFRFVCPSHSLPGKQS